MKERCYCSSEKYHKTYFKNNIKMCDEWKNNFMAFYNWAISNGYNDSLSIDRIDNLGNYEPANCRWADRIIQANNTSKNKYITIRGESHTYAEWARIAGISYKTLRWRINNGWSLILALITPS